MFNYFMTWLGMKLGNQKGQGMVEYVLIIALIAIVVMLVLGPLGEIISATFEQVTTELTPAP